MRIRDLGYTPGILPTGPTNSILDIDGLHISQVTVPTTANLNPESTASKGVTVVSPRPPKEYYQPCRAGTFCFNGNGEFTGSRQIADWGFTNTPIAFTNSLSLGSVFDASWDWALEQQKRIGWDWDAAGKHFGTPVVGETCDWIINEEVPSTRVGRDDIKRCFDGLKSREDGAKVYEGQKGGGCGMTCHQFAGGTGTSSRTVNPGDDKSKQYTLAALCQSNYGLREDLVIGGVPIGKILKKQAKAGSTSETIKASALEDIPAGRTKDGSIIILVVTDAPLTTNELDRVARHITVGLCQVGSYGVGRNSSGDIFVALSTASSGPEVREGSDRQKIETYATEYVKSQSIDPFFYACAEAVEEAILNSMVGAADGVVAMNGTKIEGFPINKVKGLLEQHLVKV
ncbi:uncharacterized protein LTR77_003698 [Saxophila tyrrhenica]|uniref:Uncharacterized protein n=1 Tax=Saxophila tyrrhenica TaxID=1690608 RepID=A0AAV9PH94_9PEZI|nr:hypothetical protein LTR77_003698 [Saxophila tyrrhenica]